MQDFNGQICGPCEVAISGHLGFGTITWQHNQYGRKLCLKLCEYLKMNVQRCMSWNWTIHCWRGWVIPDMQEWAAKYDMCNTWIGRVGSRRRRSHGRAVSPRRTQNTASLSRVFVEGSSRARRVIRRGSKQRGAPKQGGARRFQMNVTRARPAMFRRSVWSTLCGRYRRPIIPLWLGASHWASVVRGLP